MNRRDAIIAYLRSCIDSADWHAVSDAANDLRELDVAMHMLQTMGAPKRRTDADLPPLPEAFVDERGRIQNLFEAGEDEEPARGVAIIESMAGTVRSSHHHKKDWHYLYVLSGRMLYRARKVGETAVKEFTVSAGQIVFTPPLVDHWTEFPEDCVLVSMSKLCRRHEEHESDLVRVEWLDASRSSEPVLGEGQ